VGNEEVDFEKKKIEFHYVRENKQKKKEKRKRKRKGLT